MNSDLIKKLQTSLRNPLFIKKKENLFYLTGYDFDARAEEYLLILPKPKNTKNSKRNNTNGVGFGSGLEQINWIKKTDRLKNIGKYLKGYDELDIEYGFTYGEGRYLRVKGSGVRVKPAASPVDRMRMIKEPEEIEKIKKSMKIVERVFMLVRKEIKKPGMTERKLADFIQSTGLKMGAEDLSFPAIVACGPNAAIPHHVPGNYRLRPNQSIIIDFGFKYKKYCSDFTRTVFLKSAPKKLVEAYNQVEKAYLGAMEFIDGHRRTAEPLPLPRGSTSRSEGRGFVLAKTSHPVRLTASTPPWQSLPRTQSGEVKLRMLTGDHVYQKSVSILSEKKLDKYFIHSLGHGTGLEIHELPNLSPKSKDILQNGMVFSIEPGVYFPNVGGIRIEDLVYLNKNKIKRFINVPTTLKENII